MKLIKYNDKWAEKLIDLAYLHNGISLVSAIMQVRDILYLGVDDEEKNLIFVVGINPINTQLYNLVVFAKDNKFPLLLVRVLREILANKRGDVFIIGVDNFKTIERWAKKYNGVRLGDILYFRKDK